jgi:hypothetical protein
MFSLIFSDVPSDSSQMGGGAWLENAADWPISTLTGKPLTPLITLRQSLFIIPTIPENMAVTVFIPIEYDRNQIKSSTVRQYTANDPNQLSALSESGACVLLHKLSSTELLLDNCHLLPKLSISKRKFNDEEMQEENEDDIIGLQTSKLFGRPGWLQDELFPPDPFDFTLQIFERDLYTLKPEYEGIFRDGAGYLFLNEKLKKLNSKKKTGLFIAQFT